MAEWLFLGGITMLLIWAAVSVHRRDQRERAYWDAIDRMNRDRPNHPPPIRFQ